MEKLKIKSSDYNILKAYIQAQLLLETLDDVEEESKMNIKHATKKYKTQLESKIEEVIKNTFNSNKTFFDEIMKTTQKNFDKINNYFQII